MSFNLLVFFELKENEVGEQKIRDVMNLIQNNNNYDIKDFDKKLNELFSKNLSNTCGGASIFAVYREPKAPYDVTLSLHAPRCKCLDNKFKNFVLEVGAPLYFFKTYKFEEDNHDYKEKVRKFIRDILNVGSLLQPIHAVGDTDYNLEALKYNIDKRVGWLNFFSKHEVENIGIDRLKKLNAHRTELLASGGVFLQLTENVMDASKELKEHVEKVLSGK